MAQSKITVQQFIVAGKFALNRLILFTLLMSLVVIFGYYLKIDLIMENLKTLYFIGLLPPAVNIVVLETYYLRSGHSAPLIASGTVISLGLIVIYGGVTLYVM